MSLTASLVAACSENDTSIFVRRAAKHWVFRTDKVSGWVSRLLPTDRYEVRKQPLTWLYTQGLVMTPSGPSEIFLAARL